MLEVNYLEVIINGYVYHKDTFAEYIRRKQKEAKKQNFVSKNEFLINCNEVVKLLYNDFNKQFLLRKAELNKIIAYSRQNKESYNDVSEDLKQLNINQFVIHLYSFTNGKINGDIFFEDFLTIKNIVKSISDKHNLLNGEKKNKLLNIESVKIPINENLTFTQYKRDYALLLENYLIQYVDNTEKTFIEEQLFSFNEFLSFMINGTMTKTKKQMLLEDLEQPKTLEYLKQSTEQKIEFLENKLIEVSNDETLQQTRLIKELKEKDYKQYIWFKTGIKLATGEAFELYNKYKNDKGHFKKITIELGFKASDRPYFSDTINNNKGNKNTFADNDKIIKLHKYLTENKLNFGEVFLNKYNKIEIG